MDFSYSEQQQDVRALAAQILGDRTGPEQQRALDQTLRFDADLWSELATAGLLGVAIGDEQGGMGFDFETLCLLVEEVGRTVAAVPVIPALVSTALPLQRYGTTEQKAQLSALVKGETLLTTALIETANEDPLRPRCELRGTDSGMILHGSKSCVPYAQQASQLLLSAESEQGLQVLLIPLAGSGITVVDQYSTAGEPQAQVHFDNVAVQAAQVVATADRAEALITECLQLTRAASAAMAVGVCAQMLTMTSQYTSQREQFGVPVATFQAVGHRAADCFIDIEVLRLVTQEAVSLLTHERAAEQAVTIAQIWTGNVTHRVSQAAQHLHGGTGVDRDYPLFRYCLWARQLELSLGSSARLTEQLGTDIAMEYLLAED